ncbi:MAG: murD [Frankiales bacterium]|nr:murD [Frankiales bacterium]
MHVVLRTPRAGEVGVVEDLLVDRAFTSDVGEDVPGEATVLAELGDAQVTTVEDLHALLGAAALARAVGIGAEAVREGVRSVRADPA